jgi:mannose-1-phosphate guanylyltransferase
VRLRPLTLTRPKPLPPVAGIRSWYACCGAVAGAGVEHMVLATLYRAEDFASGLRDMPVGADVECVAEPQPLGTADGLRNVASVLRG